MKLITAHVTNFRSNENSEKFSVDQVTSLVGKNEAGKSAILLALAALNPHPSTPVVLDKERDYPRRHLIAYSERHPSEEALAVSTEWQLSNSEMEQIAEELGDGAMKGSVVTVFRRYLASEPDWQIPIDVQRAIDNTLVGHEFDDAQLASLRVSKNTVELIEKLGSLPSPTPGQQQLLARLNGYGSFTDRVKAILSPGLPYFMYFTNYDRMEGAVQFEQLLQLRANGQIEQEENRGARIFSDFLDYADVSLQDITLAPTFEAFNSQLQAASNNITDQILEYWSQNPDLVVRVDVSPAKPGDKPPFNSGTIGRARIYNQLHRVDTPFSERSAGFVWFFSFLVKFSQVKAQKNPIILLLDEPGLSLHGKAQADLLRFIDEKLAPYHQIIYSTHSPFMIAPDKLKSVRIVEDQGDLRGVRRLPIGTKVREDIVTNDPDTLFPLQGALGYQLTQVMLVGKHTLLVESPSDILFLQALSFALKQRRRIALDQAWTICPSGGIGNIKAFVSLFGGSKVDVTVLADSSKIDANNLDQFRRSEIMKAGRVFMIAEFTGKPESDIEDLFDTDLFVSIINSAFQLPTNLCLTPSALEAADPNTERLVKKAEAAFRVFPSDIPTYDHFLPAAWLINNLQRLEGDDSGVELTLHRAEKLFGTLNAVLRQ